MTSRKTLEERASGAKSTKKKTNDNRVHFKGRHLERYNFLRKHLQKVNYDAFINGNPDRRRDKDDYAEMMGEGTREDPMLFVVSERKREYVEAKVDYKDKLLGCISHNNPRIMAKKEEDLGEDEDQRYGSVAETSYDNLPGYIVSMPYDDPKQFQTIRGAAEHFALRAAERIQRIDKGLED